MIETYRVREYIQAMKFKDTESGTINAIISFVGLPVSVEFTSTGIQLRIIRGAYTVTMVRLGEYVYRDEKGDLHACTQEHLQNKYDRVSDAE